jgi:hypothetical protein
MMDSKLFFAKHQNQHQFKSISNSKNIFEIPHQYRTQHVSDPMNGSAAKRINIFKMDVSPRQQRVDLGIWKSIPTAVLSCP